MIIRRQLISPLLNKYLPTKTLWFIDQGHKEGVGGYQKFAVVFVVPFVLLKRSTDYKNPDAEGQDRPELLKEPLYIGHSYYVEPGASDGDNEDDPQKQTAVLHIRGDAIERQIEGDSLSRNKLQQPIIVVVAFRFLKLILFTSHDSYSFGFGEDISIYDHGR